MASFSWWQLGFIFVFPVAFGIAWAVCSILDWNEGRKKNKAKDIEARNKYVAEELAKMRIRPTAKPVGRLTRYIDV